MEDFVSTEVERLELTDGKWIEVKHELSLAEFGRVTSAGLDRMRAGGEDGTDFGVDLGNVNIVKIDTWVTDWNLVDRNDKPQKKTLTAIRNLSQGRSDQILEAIEKYQEHLEIEKKVKPGRRKRRTTSAS